MTDSKKPCNCVKCKVERGDPKGVTIRGMADQYTGPMPESERKAASQAFTAGAISMFSLFLSHERQAVSAADVGGRVAGDACMKEALDFLTADVRDEVGRMAEDQLREQVAAFTKETGLKVTVLTPAMTLEEAIQVADAPDRKEATLEDKGVHCMNFDTRHKTGETNN